MCFALFKLMVVYEGNDFRVPHKFIKVQCVATAVPESQQLLMPNSLWCNGDRPFFSLTLCSSTVTLLSLSSKQTSVLLSWRKKNNVFWWVSHGTCVTGALFTTCRGECMCRFCMCQRGSDRKKGDGKGNAASLKLGAEPKATKLALDPTSLSPVETSSGIEHMRTVVLFKGNHFPLARSLNGYKMRSLSCHHRNARKT